MDTLQIKENSYRFKIYEGPPTSYALDGKWYWYYDLTVPCRILDYHDHIFVHIPKTGGTSLLYNHLIGKDRPFSLGHMYARHYPLQYHPKLFTIVRNPYSRLVSAYMFMKRGGFNNNASYRKLIGSYPTFESWILHGLTERDLVFDEKNVVSELTTPQYEFVCDSGEFDERTFLVPPHQILRFENYANEIQKYLRIPKEMQYHYNYSFKRGKEENWKKSSISFLVDYLRGLYMR